MEEKIDDLEKKISQLRTGRRILMHLLEHSLHEKIRQIIRLERENQYLRKQNRRYAAELLQLRAKIKKDMDSR
ncbi:hypothetical protein [Effusibacillus dendaii]|uniref:Translation initiation factor 2 n=1 Tax=Effusibacillus dendaii TaxID=2743772 RepID=A0A7I8DB49_9BACL|nr:hypothetical protein [Effusibacillus dendaii]BCJ85740.1 hypothetical protein skT53_07250 [Effusibacillus dendaii]